MTGDREASPRQSYSAQRLVSYIRRSWTERRMGPLFLAASVAFFPFQQALTINVGFPLKASEVFVVLGIVFCLVERRIPRIKNFGTIAIAVLLMLVVVSSAWNAFDVPFFEKSPAYPSGTGVDLVQYTLYAVLALLFCVFLTTVDPQTLLRALGWAVRLAAVYAGIQLVFWAFDSTALSFVNGNAQIGRQYGVSLPRNGPMREGNYLGAFSAAAVFLLAHRRDGVGAALAVFLIAYTQSTGAMAGVLVGILAGVVLRPTLRKAVISAAVAAVGILVALVVPTLNRLVQGQLTKLGLIENELGPSYTYSLRHRSAQAETGFAMAGDHPLLGVGQGRYAYYFDDYLDRKGLPANFAENWTRPIANNVYAQISAETGLLALAVLAAMFVWIAIRARKTSSTLLGAIAAIATSVVAFPAWTNLFLWGLIGIILGVANSARSVSPRHGSRRAFRDQARLRSWEFRPAPR